MRRRLLTIVVCAGCAPIVSPGLRLAEPTDLASRTQAACDQGVAESCLARGYAYRAPRRGAADAPRALASFSRGCALGSGESCTNEAAMIEAGQGAPIDLDKATLLHRRACSLGHASSCEDERRLVKYAELPGELNRDPRCVGECVGGLDKADIYRVMRRREGSVRYCYSVALQSNEHLTADVATKFVINEEGLVEQCESPQSTNAALSECVVKALRTFRFPRPLNGGQVNVTFPYRFRTAD